MSEEFGGALPTEIWAQQQQLPDGFLERVIEYRAIANAIATYEQNPKARGGVVDEVIAVEHELAAEKMARLRG